MNLQSYYETKKIKTMKVLIDREIQKQADRHTENLSYMKSMELVMTKMFNVRH